MALDGDFYSVLGVERSASQDAIRSAYRKLARQYHPDVNKDPDAAKRFAEVTEAYDVLSDEEKRKTYDRYGHVSGAGAAGAAGGQAYGRGAWGPGPGGARTYTWSGTGPGVGGADFDVDFGDVFEQMFGGAGVRSPFGAGAAKTRTAEPPRQARGRDVHHAITVTFMTAALGGAETLRYEAASPGMQAETIEVKIPPGIDTGAKLRIKGKGQPSLTGGPAGDLILTVTVGAHPKFRREGLDVLVDLPISFVEAMRGVSADVPLLTGSATLTVPPGTSSSKRLRIRGKGIRDSSGNQGDFYAVIQIVVPEQGTDALSEEGKKSLSTLADELPNPRNE